jgi:hypothetical protein
VGKRGVDYLLGIKQISGIGGSSSVRQSTGLEWLAPDHTGLLGLRGKHTEEFSLPKPGPSRHGQ